MNGYEEQPRIMPKDTVYAIASVGVRVKNDYTLHAVILHQILGTYSYITEYAKALLAVSARVLYSTTYHYRLPKSSRVNQLTRKFASPS